MAELETLIVDSNSNNICSRNACFATLKEATQSYILPTSSMFEQRTEHIDFDGVEGILPRRSTIPGLSMMVAMSSKSKCFILSDWQILQLSGITFMSAQGKVFPVRSHGFLCTRIKSFRINLSFASVVKTSDCTMIFRASTKFPTGA